MLRASHHRASISAVEGRSGSLKSSNRITGMGTLVLSMALILVAAGVQPVTAISNGSSLGWLAEPATASVDRTITSAVGDPTGPRVKVALFNGSGQRARTEGVPIKLVVASGAASGAVLPGAT